jgi:hypothetical protein
MRRIAAFSILSRTKSPAMGPIDASAVDMNAIVMSETNSDTVDGNVPRISHLSSKARDADGTSALDSQIPAAAAEPEQTTRSQRRTPPTDGDRTNRLHASSLNLSNSGNARQTFDRGILIGVPPQPRPGPRVHDDLLLFLRVQIHR